MNTSRSRSGVPGRFMLALVIVALMVLVVACGAAPTPPPTATPVPPTPTLTANQRMTNVSFAKHILPLFQKNCTRCHSGANAPTGLSLDSYEAVMKGNTVGPVVSFWGNGQGDTGRSMVYRVLATGAMPKGADKLADEDLQMVAAWIASNARDN